MKIALEDARIENRLTRKDPVPFLEQAGRWQLDVEPGEVVRVSGDSNCLLANIFYVLIGARRPDDGRLGGDAAASEERPQLQGIGVLDFRSALQWDRTVLQNVMAAIPKDAEDREDIARRWLDRCGVGAGLTGMPSVWAKKAKRTRDADERDRLQAAASDVYAARPAFLPDADVHHRAQLARELAGGPRMLFVLDSCDCAARSDYSALYPLIAELAAEQSVGVVLFSRRALDDVGWLAREYRFTREETAVELVEVALGTEPVTPDVSEHDVVLRLESLSKRYGGGPIVIEDISFEVERGKLMVVMGGSGCGKSTLLRLVAGITGVTAGRAYFNPLDEHQQPLGMRQIAGDGITLTAEVRKMFGVLFQDGALFNSMSVEQNISAPILEHTPLHKNVVSGMVEIKLKQVNMWGDDPLRPEHSHKLPSELSGGQRKRVALARSLALDPQVIFYDEPSAGLDPIVSRQIDELMVDLGQVLGVTSMVITHELDSAFAIADRMVVLRKSEERANEYWGPARMVAQGDREEIMGCVHPHVVDFLHDYSYHYQGDLARWTGWYKNAF